MDMKRVSQGWQITTKEVYKAEDTTKTKREENKRDDNSFTKQEVDEAVLKLNKHLADDNAYAEYSVHDKFPDIMIKIVDNVTKEVLLEVPPKKILDMVAKLCEMAGVVVDRKA